MYSNLLDELNKKGISINAAAKIIDMPEATLRTKIQSRSFDVDEAFALRDNLFPEFDMRYLFKKDNTKSAQEEKIMKELKKCEPTVEQTLIAQHLRECQLKLGSHRSRKYAKLTKQILEIAKVLSSCEY